MYRVFLLCLSEQWPLESLLLHLIFPSWKNMWVHSSYFPFGSLVAVLLGFFQFSLLHFQRGLWNYRLLMESMEFFSQNITLMLWWGLSHFWFQMENFPSLLKQLLPLEDCLLRTYWHQNALLDMRGYWKMYSIFHQMPCCRVPFLSFNKGHGSGICSGKK